MLNLNIFDLDTSSKLLLELCKNDRNKYDAVVKQCRETILTVQKQEGYSLHLSAYALLRNHFAADAEKWDEEMLLALGFAYVLAFDELQKEGKI